MKKSTKCIFRDNDFQGVNTPIFTSTANEYIGYDRQNYPRYFNTVNQDEIVNTLSLLENSETGIVLSSGMAAISTALFSFLKPHDHIILSSEIYGGSNKLIVDEFTKFNIEFDFINGSNIENYKSKIKTNTKVIYTETPSNPLLSIVDLKAIAQISSENSVISIVDNTFATPINQNPINLGFDLVIHSGTKYLGGHSDLCFGAILGKKKHIEIIRNTAMNFGGSLNALDCYLIDRSLKTLAIRVHTHNSNAFEVARFLLDNKHIDNVYYPGLESHPNHEIAKQQMIGGFGGMLSFDFKEESIVPKFLENLSIVKPSLSLGGVESIICQPSLTSHLKMSKEDREKINITNGLLRLSVGLENVDDLKLDISKAIKNATQQCSEGKPNFQ
jgi:cystathionine beta-lyase